jgi:hypothetical protein
MASRLKIVMSFGFKKGTQIYFFYSLKNSDKRNSSRFPDRTPIRRNIRLQGIFHIRRKLIKFPLNKKVLRKKRPSMFFKSGAPMEADAHFQALLNISIGVSSKGALHNMTYASQEISCII